METDSGAPTKNSGIDVITDRISHRAFSDWYQEKQYKKNIENGTPYFNGPSKVPDPSRHSPSNLLQCHRKTFYKQLNAPEETTDPDGIFWIGSRFEEEIALPYLREAVIGNEEYVTNSLWVDFTVETDVGQVQIKGETDPVIVDQDAEPILLTEIKTKQSVEDVRSPNNHHKAQAHAYMKGLSEKYDHNVTDAMILYGGRTELDVKPFHIEFDPVYWRQTVVEWAETHTNYRLDDRLPPANPEYNWECNFCSFRERCGKGDEDYSDVSDGLLSGYTGYPRSKVENYLEAHDGEKLTHALAAEYPELASKYDVENWECETCRSTLAWDDILLDDTKTVHCPNCDSGDEPGQSVASQLKDQHRPEILGRKEDSSEA